MSAFCSAEFLLTLTSACTNEPNDRPAPDCHCEERSDEAISSKYT